jgi:membrane dipeptidase
MPWFDAHLDLACLAENGRDMTRGPDDCGGPWQPATLTFPSMSAGGVAACLGTIFTEADGDDAVRYPAGDAQAAHAAGLRQLERYQQWERDGLIRLWQGPQRPAPAQSRGPISLGILMECADPIRTPDELDWWAQRGVVAIGMAWGRGSRYASGNSEPSCSGPVGLTDIGLALVRRMDDLGIVHDISHLSDRALADLLEATDRPIIASHSNCRALLDGVSQRHLTDAAIKEVGRRGGIIGLNLVKYFVRTGLSRTDPADRPTADEAAAHVEHICGLMGHRRGVGLGSDLDGGISGHDLPAGIDSPSGFRLLADALARRGWSGADLHNFEWGNWARFWRLSAPAG